jgi:hypothetical protein
MIVLAFAAGADGRYRPFVQRRHGTNRNRPLPAADGKLLCGLRPTADAYAAHVDALGASAVKQSTARVIGGAAALLLGAVLALSLWPETAVVSGEVLVNRWACGFG